MKLIPRNTKNKVLAKRITAPETRTDRVTGKKTLLLSYGDMSSNHRHDPTTRELFLYAAGTDEEGELPNGLDRLSFHRFRIHQDAKGNAIGLDVVPARMYRSKVIPRSKIGVDTIVVSSEVGGAVMRVIQSPANTRAELCMAVIDALDEMAASGRKLSPNMKLGNVGTIVSVGGDTVEIRPKPARKVVAGLAHQSVEESIADVE